VIDPFAVNGYLKLVGEAKTAYNHSPAPLYAAYSSSGVFTITADFVNVGGALTDLFFQVTELRSRDAGVDHYLLNAKDGPGQAGALYPIANISLPDVSLPAEDSWDNGEILPVPFVIGLLARRPFVFLVDVYGKRSDMARADEDTWLGHFEFAYTPPDTPTETPDTPTSATNKLFLPLVQR
jgi:hypothetical protein